jgi:hypothetical protein
MWNVPLWAWQARAFTGESTVAPTRDFCVPLGPLYPPAVLPFIVGALFLLPAIVHALIAYAYKPVINKRVPVLKVFGHTLASFIIIPLFYFVSGLDWNIKLYWSGMLLIGAIIYSSIECKAALERALLEPISTIMMLITTAATAAGASILALKIITSEVFHGSGCI